MWHSRHLLRRWLTGDQKAAKKSAVKSSRVRVRTCTQTRQKRKKEEIVAQCIVVAFVFICSFCACAHTHMDHGQVLEVKCSLHDTENCSEKELKFMGMAKSKDFEWVEKQIVRLDKMLKGERAMCVLVGDSC